MKKLLVIIFVLLIVSAAASAQSGTRRYRSRETGIGSSLTVTERAQLKRDVFRYRGAKRAAGRDGRIGLFEKRRLHKMKCKTRHDAVRSRHNRRNRVI